MPVNSNPLVRFAILFAFAITALWLPISEGFSYHKMMVSYDLLKLDDTNSQGYSLTFHRVIHRSRPHLRMFLMPSFDLLDYPDQSVSAFASPQLVSTSILPDV
ncbi:MAG: hypothetical protein M9911_10255 [Saprospiraceae bacterium]|nr:hypothetical protein [Saprospiraceae bacterium]